MTQITSNGKRIDNGMSFDAANIIDAIDKAVPGRNRTLPISAIHTTNTLSVGVYGANNSIQWCEFAGTFNEVCRAVVIINA